MDSPVVERGEQGGYYTKGCTGEFDCGTVLYSGHTGLSIKTHRSVYSKKVKKKVNFKKITCRKVIGIISQAYKYFLIENFG